MGEAGRGLHRHFRGAGDAAECSRDLLCFLVEDIEIVAENVHGDCGGVARKSFFDPLAQEGLDREVHADKAPKRLADVSLRPLLLVSRESGLQVDFKFTVVGPENIAGKFGTADPLCYRPHGGDLAERVCYARTDCQRAFDRCAGNR